MVRVAIAEVEDRLAAVIDVCVCYSNTQAVLS